MYLFTENVCVCIRFGLVWLCRSLCWLYMLVRISHALSLSSLSVCVFCCRLQQTNDFVPQRTALNVCVSLDFHCPLNIRIHRQTYIRNNWIWMLSLNCSNRTISPALATASFHSPFCPLLWFFWFQFFIFIFQSDCFEFPLFHHFSLRPSRAPFL